MTINRYLLKYFFFFSQFLVVLCIKLFILLFHTFTCTVWVSLIAKHSFGILKGRFYPNMKVSIIEDGSLAYRTQ